MKTNDIILPVAAFALGAFIAKKSEGAAVGARKKTIVKQWWGSSNDDSKATYKEFDTKKEAQKYIDRERRFNAMQGNQYSGASNFYEIVDTKKLNRIGNDIRFFVRPNFGHFSVIDNTTNKMWVGYGKKDKAQKTADGLNAISDPIELQNMLTYLKTSEGYGHFVR